MYFLFKPFSFLFHFVAFSLFFYILSLLDRVWGYAPAYLLPQESLDLPLVQFCLVCPFSLPLRPCHCSRHFLGALEGPRLHATLASPGYL